jgi:cytoskeletal protein CcmA (bactofilin family)
MFGSKNKNLKVDTLIGKTTEIKGDIIFNGGLHLDGKVIGNVSAEDDTGSTLIVSNNGSIEGDVTVPNIILNGDVAGDVFAIEKIELAKLAKVNGNVYYNFLEMAMGAKINGNMVHRLREDNALLEHKKDDVEEAKIIDSEIVQT